MALAYKAGGRDHFQGEGKENDSGREGGRDEVRTGMKWTTCARMHECTCSPSAAASFSEMFFAGEDLKVQKGAVCQGENLNEWSDISSG